MMKTVLMNGEKMAYEEIGSGLPIIFIHPPGMGRVVFYEQKPLSQKFRLILPDLIGHGDSSYDGKSDVTIRRFSDDIRNLMDHLLIDKAVIFGYSAGGTIAQEFCIHNQDRVLALIMSGGFPSVDHFILKNEHRIGIYTVKNNQIFLANVLAMSHTKDKAYQAILREHMYKANKQVWAKFYEESLHYNCRTHLKGLAIPVLLMYGSKSDAINKYSRFYKKNLYNHKIRFIKGARHQLPTKEPNKLNKIVSNFLTQPI
jgi:pimeloyl-ACP methyl ester carboxylesterase